MVSILSPVSSVGRAEASPMGATPSKSPDWYPGEPERLCDECVCSQPATAYVETTTANSAERVAGAMKNHERGRKITNLPVVELTDMKVSEDLVSQPKVLKNC